MLTTAKINLKKYGFLSAALLIAELAISKNAVEVQGMLVIFAAACLNQFMLVNVVRSASQNAAYGTEVNKGKMIIFSLGKVILLVAALIYGVHLMGNRVIIPLLIYVLQIAVLYLSFESKKSEN